MFLIRLLLVLLSLIVAGCAREWWRLLRGTKRIVLHESEFVAVNALELARN
jgi:hypothetical protein